MCIPDVVKNINPEVFHLMSRTNETGNIKGHKTCKGKCRIDASVFNNKQSWNEDKCRCEYKELIDKDVWDKGFIWNPNNCECECDKLCDDGEYLGYENYKCIKWFADKLVEECTESVEEVILDGITSMKLYSAGDKRVCKYSCAIYVVLIAIIFTISIGIGTYFVYKKYRNRPKENVSRYNYVYQATIH